jgi:hypothetical protein
MPAGELRAGLRLVVPSAGLVMLGVAIEGTTAVVSTTHSSLITVAPLPMLVVILYSTEFAAPVVPRICNVVAAVPATFAGLIVRPGAVVGMATNAKPLIEASTVVRGFVGSGVYVSSAGALIPVMVTTFDTITVDSD